MFADVSIHSNSLFYVASFLKIKELPLALRLLIWKCTLTFNGATFQSPHVALKTYPSVVERAFPAAGTNQRNRNMLSEDPWPMLPTQEMQSLAISQAVTCSITTHSISPAKRWNRSVPSALPWRSQQADLTAFLAIEEDHSWNSESMSGWGWEGDQEITQGSFPAADCPRTGSDSHLS